jgi:hypothetical protein
LKIVAYTSTVSPTVRFTWYRPQSTIGSIACSWMRDGGWVVSGRGIVREILNRRMLLNQ